MSSSVGRTKPVFRTMDDMGQRLATCRCRTIGQFGDGTGNPRGGMGHGKAIAQWNQTHLAVAKPGQRSAFFDQRQTGGLVREKASARRKAAAAANFFRSDKNIGDGLAVHRARQMQGDIFKAGAGWCKNNVRIRAKAISDADARTQLIEMPGIVGRRWPRSLRPLMYQPAQMIDSRLGYIVRGRCGIGQRGAWARRGSIDIDVAARLHADACVAACRRSFTRKAVASVRVVMPSSHQHHAPTMPHGSDNHVTCGMADHGRSQTPRNPADARISRCQPATCRQL